MGARAGHWSRAFILSATLVPEGYAHGVYEGACDASAAIAIGADHFLAADDEGETLRLYRHSDGVRARIIREFDFAGQLREDPDRECDIEGAARIGDVAYWITSHGRNGYGKIRKNRQRLFATKIEGGADDLKVAWIGRYDNLIADLLNKEAWRGADSGLVKSAIKAIEAAAKPDEYEDADLAPKVDGLNIEALAAYPDGSGLLIGLRNPVPEGKALVIHLKNPQELMTGQATQAEFGDPIRMDLKGLGLRGMAYCAKVKRFVLLCGPSGVEGPFYLYLWNGLPDSPPIMNRRLRAAPGVNPEALAVYPESSRIQIIHDEGAREVDGAECKDLPASERTFSDAWLDLLENLK